MKVLHINWRDSGGGAFTACERLHRAMLNCDVDSWILCDVPSGKVPKVVGMRRASARGSFSERLRARFRYEIKRFQRPPFFIDPTIHSTISLNYSRNGLFQKIQEINPDLIHIHWVGYGFMRIEDLTKIVGAYPVVWTLHDMWPFCGAEHYAYTEDRWRNGYTCENRPAGARGPDFGRLVWGRKLRAWQELNIHTIGVSSWADQCVRESRLFREIKGNRRFIHNGLDTSVFQPLAKDEHSRSSSRVKRQPWRILFGAVNPSNRIKGGDLLLDALKILLDYGKRVELTTFGGLGLTAAEIPLNNRGRIDEPSELARLYASADVMVVPSRLETFGQVAAEALACGTPVVSFDTSGLRDIVEHMGNGYRARCYAPEDLANGIHWCLSDPARHKKLCLRARQTALERFRVDDIVAQTISFYEEILVNS